MYPSKVYSLFVGIAPSSHLCDLCSKQKSAYGRNTEADNKRFYLLCTKCHAYHVEFGNLFFTFTEDEFEHFYQYINSIDGEYYQELNKNMKNARKIFLRMPVKGFYCALYPDELKELRRLIDFSLTDDAIESALSLENYCLN